MRRSTSVDVVDPSTVRLNLSQPFSPLLAAADRPRRHDGVAQGGRRPPATTSAPSPVCSGPYKFVERVAQDRIVLERFRQLLEQGAASTSTASSTCRSRTPPCGWPTCKSGAARHHRARGLQRHGEDPRRQERCKTARIDRARLPGHHHQHRQGRARPRRTRWARTRACARRSSCRSTARAIVQVVMDGEAHRRQPVGRADQPVLRQERAGAQARRRAAPRRC